MGKLAPRYLRALQITILILAAVAMTAIALTGADGADSPYTGYGVQNAASDAASDTAQEIDTYLIMGIDKPGPVQRVTDYTAGGQADLLALLVVDHGKRQFSLITIHRNAMCDVDVYSPDNEYMFTATMQLCMQHGYGDGAELSCRRTVDAVRRLFGGIEIDGYVAVNMDAISIVNDAVGGVQVTVLEDVVYPDAGVDLRAGEVRTLNGTEAYYYTRTRNIDIYDSASGRLARDKQYISSFMDTFRALPHKVSTAMDIYQGVRDYIVTDLSIGDMISMLSGYDLSEDHIYNVPGQVVMGQVHEEYYVDEAGLKSLIGEVYGDEDEQ